MPGLNSHGLGALVFSNGLIRDVNIECGVGKASLRWFPCQFMCLKFFFDAGLVTCNLSFMNLQLISSVFFRGGVSEGKFYQVILYELDAIHKVTILWMYKSHSCLDSY